MHVVECVDLLSVCVHVVEWVDLLSVCACGGVGGPVECVCMWWSVWTC